MIEYLNTDLDLASRSDLTPLAAAFEARGIFTLHVSQEDEGSWSAWFETEAQHREPDTNIAAMLDVVDSLPEPEQRLWSDCTLREFNIGYEWGTEPRVFDQGLTSGTLGRMAAAGASLRITLYPNSGG